jgi:hypothetical protein
VTTTAKIAPLGYVRALAELPRIAKKLIDEDGDVIRDRFLFAPADTDPAVYGSRAL